MSAHEEPTLTDPDSLHYERANMLSHYASIKDVLSPEDKDSWLDSFETALSAEIQYAADNRNHPREAARA